VENQIIDNADKLSWIPIREFPKINYSLASS